MISSLRGNWSRSAWPSSTRRESRFESTEAATALPARPTHRPMRPRSRPQSLPQPPAMATAAAATTPILSPSHLLGRRPISSEPSSSRSTPISTWHTTSVMGSSMSSRFARSRSTGVRPPRPGRSRRLPPRGRATRDQLARAWLRPRRLQHVTIRSPILASPANVSGRAPQAAARRDISARPRVISAALALSPNSSPSTPPAASAITFLAAAQSSTPIRSVPIRKICERPC